MEMKFITSYEFRNDPMFLRNQFRSVGMFKLPLVKKQEISLEDVSLIGYDKVNQSNDYKSIVHFFLDDYKFESIYNDPEKKLEKLKWFKAVLTPDFSMFVEMPIALQLFATFKNRWVGAFLQEQGIKVIPTVRWGDLASFNFCFDGIEKGSIVAVSTVGVKKQKSLFMLGYNEMLSRIKPSKIICYGKPFDEMKGDIIEVDYAKTNNLTKAHPDVYIKTFYGYVERPTARKGVGSTDGQSAGNPEPQQTWTPKSKEAERFLGEPGEVKRTFISTKKGGYWVETKIGADGRATIERQYTDHGRPDKHSSPHDNIIGWKENGEPNWVGEINYFGEEAPEFKYFKITGVSKMNNDYDGSFKNKEEFKSVISRGCELSFEWKGSEYCIFRQNDKNWFFGLVGTDTSKDVLLKTLDDVMNCEIDGEKLVDICTKFTVIERTF